jgi:hypothetical protein
MVPTGYIQYVEGIAFPQWHDPRIDHDADIFPEVHATRPGRVDACMHKYINTYVHASLPAYQHT